MPTPMRTWIAQEKKKNAGMSLEEASTKHFFRDPMRVTPSCRDFFFSPADGFVTLLGRFDPETDLIDVKGAQCSLNTLLGPANAIDVPAAACAIFMSFLDVHVNRTPSECVLTRSTQPSLRTLNRPMLFEEYDLLYDLKIKGSDMGFMADNDRVVNVCYVPYMRYTYYVVQIADSDVDCIVPLNPDLIHRFNQNERIGSIRWGSMCVLILPLCDRYKFRPTIRVKDHVCCCEDTLFSVESRRSSRKKR